MKIVLAPNALKGSLTAAEAADALARGVARAASALQKTVELLPVPVADGGDGLIDVLAESLGAQRITVDVTGPRFEPVAAAMAWLPARRIAVIEMAQASGLARLPASARDPTATTTLGTGALLRAALDLGADTVIVGLGGSATNDGGIGLATALGWRFLDAAGAPLAPIGASLAAIEQIDGRGADLRLGAVRIEAICDVDTPLTGPRGAARTFGPQKGATPTQVAALDAGLAHLAGRIERDLGVAVADLPGAGAAGGLGAGLVAFCGARLAPGAERVLDLVDLDRVLAGADLVLTAEGRLDGQTLHGKAPAAVAARAARLGIPCIAIVGGLGDDLAGETPERAALHAAGFTALFSLCPGPMPLAQAEAQAGDLLADAAEQVARVFLHRR